MSEPKRAGLMNLLRSSAGVQFVIPVYQRNYTWSADREVKQYLSDLTHVLTGDYNNHFLGILIYLEKSIDFSTREFSIIDGQQRLTTTFLTLYVLKEMLLNNGHLSDAQKLEAQILTNPFHEDKIKYKLKPLVSDDDVYRSIVEGRLSDANHDSNVFKNYTYIRDYIHVLVDEKGFTPNEILLALDKLYVVCVPISEEDNAQKIFESINATGVKLTGADLIRNYLLMNLDSDTQDKYYEKYWKKIEENVSSDSKDLEMFFRMYLATKIYSLVAKNSVYRNFVQYVETKKIAIGSLFKDLLEYAKIYNSIFHLKIKSLNQELQKPLTDFRKVNSDIPLSVVMEFFSLFKRELISADDLAQIIETINAFMVRRSICDMDSQNISKLFPTTLKKVLETCKDDFSNIVSIFNQELVGNNADTSGSYMPTDTQMHDILYSANVYKRPALRIILDRLELNNNPAPVDLSKLSIEHLMPQTPTDEWLEELDTDEETYMSNLHRLGNLTLAAKPDNSKMSNMLWDYKNEVLASTAHLKLNMELISVEKWTLSHIDSRTSKLIEQICEAFPYPKVSISYNKTEDNIDERKATDIALQHLFPSSNYVSYKDKNVYKSPDNKIGYVLSSSKLYPKPDKERYWFSYDEKRYSCIADCQEQHYVFICRNKTGLVLDIPKCYMDEIKECLNNTIKDNQITHYHVELFNMFDGRILLSAPNPTMRKIDISKYVITE